MRTLTLALALVCLAACSHGSGGATPASPYQPVSSLPVTPGTTPTPTTAPTATPAPIATPTPTYTIGNHPLTGHDLTNAVPNSLILSANGTYEFTDSQHITYGTWTPDPNPNDVVRGQSAAAYPMTLTPSGSYVCLPVNGPQTCQNYGYAGPVLVSVDSQYGNLTITEVVQ